MVEKYICFKKRVTQQHWVYSNVTRLFSKMPENTREKAIFGNLFDSQLFELDILKSTTSCIGMVKKNT
ncbi:unnamed protein product [Caenorhabditis angaria]|uniref:Uncharacterized protein n=1 Tax=Caenorhabditis angaria TaxID=860376 RepID=A0A9P1IVI0_9PELO|nr:unnamed protein product [Caenorhabditis angaria]